MENEMKEKIIQMLTSTDWEIRRLGLVMAEGVIKSVEHYHLILNKVDNPIMKFLLRKVVINGKGKLRRKIKQYHKHGKRSD